MGVYIDGRPKPLYILQTSMGIDVEKYGNFGSLSMAIDRHRWTSMSVQGFFELLTFSDGHEFLFSSISL